MDEHEDDMEWEEDSTMCLKCGAFGFRRADGYRVCCGGLTDG